MHQSGDGGDSGTVEKWGDILSFKIALYSCTSPTNQVSKAIGGAIDVITGTLRDSSSIIDPVIICHLDNNTAWRKQLNYAFIEEFGRYYYITNIINVAGTLASQTYPSPTALWELHMHVDVLMSFQSQIKQQTAIVSRQANEYNLYLDDGSFMVYQDPMIQTKYFSVEAPFETQEFVLMVAGS